MANLEHIEILEQGVEAWNRWRAENPEITPDLRYADLTSKNLQGVNFSRGQYAANLIYAKLTNADLTGADCRGACFNMAEMTSIKLIRADLRNAELLNATLYAADFTGADCSGASFWGSNISCATLLEANFSGGSLENVSLYNSNLTKATLVNTNLCTADLTKACVDDADFTGSRIFGISAWALRGTPKSARELQINYIEEPVITVDNLEIAQFIHLLLRNEKIRDVIDTITSKVVLILGRFTDERKPILEAISDEVRRRNYLPVLFDFKGPENRDITETISTLAHLARFVIADITDAKSVLQELRGIVTDLPSLPIMPILLSSQEEPGMFGFFKRYPWFLETFYYSDTSEVINSLDDKIIRPLEEKFLQGQNRQ